MMDTFSAGFFWIPNFRHSIPIFDTLYGRPFACRPASIYTCKLFTARKCLYTHKRACGRTLLGTKQFPHFCFQHHVNLLLMPICIVELHLHWGCCFELCSQASLLHTYLNPVVAQKWTSNCLCKTDKCWPFPVVTASLKSANIMNVFIILTNTISAKRWFFCIFRLKNVLIQKLFKYI